MSVKIHLMVGTKRRNLLLTTGNLPVHILELVADKGGKLQGDLLFYTVGMDHIFHLQIANHFSITSCFSPKGINGNNADL